jgi:hypothetical protein
MRSIRRLATILLALFLNAGVLAQSGVGISPPRVELPTQPGAELTQTILVDHPGAVGTMEVDVSLSDVLLGPDGNPIYLGAGLHPRSLGPWLSLTPLRFSLAPQERIEARYTVQVPADAESGTYWGVVFFESGPVRQEEAPAQGIGVRTRVRVGHVVYVHVGEVVREGQISGIRFEPPASANRPAEVRIVFQNTGNGLIRLNGTVEVRTMEGILVDELTVTNVASFPGATHEIGVAVGEGLDGGEYLVLAVLDYGEATIVAGEGFITVP